MKINYMMVEQAGPSAYAVFSPHGYQVALVQCPPDGQFMADYKTMEVVTRVLALRYGVIDTKGKSTYHG